MNNNLSSDGRTEARARLVLIGGFLGAGKTTAAAQFARFLKKHGRIAGVVTNDHGSELVDSTTLRAQGVPAESLQGGPLCGRQEEFVKVASRLMEQKDVDVLITEPIGTCRGLARDFIEPLQRSPSGQFTFAPLSVMLDAVRARQLLETEAPTSKQAHSLFQTQIEEADLLVINKSDLIPARELAQLRAELAERVPSAQIFTISAAHNSGLDEWFECIMSKEWAPHAAAERKPETAHDDSISWLNCTVSLSSVRYFEPGKLLVDLATCVQSLLKQEGGDIVHLKMALKADHDASDIASLSLVQHDSVPKLLRDVSEPIQRGELFLSARAEADPEILHSVLNRALLALMERSSELFARMQHCEHFKPGNSAGRRPPAAVA